jgi:hypothetical protein
MRERKGGRVCCKQDHVGVGRAATACAPFDTSRSLPHGRGPTLRLQGVTAPSMLTILITKGGCLSATGRCQQKRELLKWFQLEEL